MSDAANTPATAEAPAEEASPETAVEALTADEVAVEDAGADDGTPETTPTGEALTDTVEALLFVADKPLSYKRLRTVLGGVPTRDLEGAVADIRARLAARTAPIELRDIGGGLKFCTKREYAPYIKKLYGVRDAAAKLSPAALETLAVVAYRQPVIRAEIEAIRGVAIDSALHTLLDRRLVEQCGHREVPGRPAEYRTTQEFLMYFGLNDTSELPTIEELRAEAESGEE